MEKVPDKDNFQTQNIGHHLPLLISHPKTEFVTCRTLRKKMTAIQLLVF